MQIYQKRQEQMKTKIKPFLYALLFLISILTAGCSTANKNYRDASGVLKADTRSASGVNK